MSILSNFLLSSVSVINSNTDAIITEYNQNKIDTSEKLTELVDNARNNITQKTTYFDQTEDFPTDQEQLTEQEKKVAAKLNELEAAIANATTDEAESQARQNLHFYRETDADFLALVKQYADMEAKIANVTWRIANLTKSLNAVENRNDSDETREEKRELKRKYMRDSAEYENIRNRLYFVKPRKIRSQKEKNDAGAVTNLADITPESPLGTMFQRIGFTWEGTDIIDTYINNEHIPLFDTEYDRSYQIYPDGDGFTFEKLKINGKTYFIHFEITDNEVTKYTGYDRTKLKEQKKYTINSK